MLVEDAFAVLRDEGLSPGVRSALDAIINRVINDFDQDKRAWADRAKYRMLIDSLNGEAAANAEPPMAEVNLAQDIIPPAQAVASAPDRRQTVQAGHVAVDTTAPLVPATGVIDMEAVAQAVAKAMLLGKLHPEAKRPMTDHVEGFIAHLRRKLRGSQYLAEVSTKLRIFMSTIGDRPVYEYSKMDVLAYRDLIDQMPFDAIKHLKTDDPVKAIALNAKRPIPLPPISSTTVDAKYLSALRGIFDYLIGKGYLETNPAANVRSEQDEDGDYLLDAEVRLPFTPQIELAIFRETGKKPKNSADYWWPRFNCRQGLRLQEFTQLCVSDFRMLHGRLCLDLLHFDFDGDESHALRRSQLRLKSSAARRIFPVALDLLADGLQQLIDRRRREDGPNARLFPDETPDKNGNTSSLLSKRANRVVRGVTKDRRIVAYSARHTFAQRCDDAGIPLAVRNMFMGHEPTSKNTDTDQKKSRGKHVSARYGSPLPTAEELAWFDKIKFT